MNFIFLSLSFCLSFLFFQTQAQETRYGSVFYNPTTQQYSFTPNIDQSANAYGSYEDTINTTGWGMLRIESQTKPEIQDATTDDNTQVYALGYLEGALTGDRIYQHYLNVFALNYGAGGTPSADLVNWMEAQKQFLEQGVEKYKGSTDELGIYWYQVGLLLSQFNGLVDGYNAFWPNPISSLDLWLLNSDGDLITLLKVFPQSQYTGGPTGEEDLECSALIKMLPGPNKKFSDLYVGHATWRSYAAMMRMFKYYHTQLSPQSGTASNSVAFSGAPGFLTSKDDYYQTSAGLVTLETTISVYDLSLYDLLNPQSVLCWQRCILANRLAFTAREWVETFALYNSGTYNNQWMAVDYKVFRDYLDGNQTSVSDLLWILEQIPGRTQIGDVSQVLFKSGYWASYNIPYFNSIYVECGYPEKYQTYGDRYSYYNCSRARIFRRDQPGVQSLDDMKWLMRYNDFQNDPESMGKPDYTISARYDLRPTATYKDAYGSVDSKLTSFGLQKGFECWAQSGPTHDQQNPFSWTNWTMTVSDLPQHIGHVDVFDFDYFLMVPFPSKKSENQS